MVPGSTFAHRDKSYIHLVLDISTKIKIPVPSPRRAEGQSSHSARAFPAKAKIAG